MPRQFVTHLNMNQNQVQNAVIQPLGTAPSSPGTGQIYYDSATANYTLVWNGTAWINGLARANHTGTQLSATISDLATTVQAYHLSQFAVPTANIPMGGYTLTGLNTAPAASGQAAEYSWVLSRPLSAFTGTVTANIPMGGFTLTGLATPTASGQAAEYSWVVGRNLNTIATATATSANVPMGGYTFTGLSTTPAASGQAAEYSWVLGRALNNFTGTVSANIPMNAYTFTGLATPTSSGQAAEYSWVLGRSLNAFTGTVTANIPMGGYTFSGLATPTAAGQAAEYSWVLGQVQSAASGISSKDPVLAVSVANIATLSGLTTTVDGVALNTVGMRVLLTAQTTATQNGPYVIQSGAWTRPVDEGGAQGELDNGALWLSLTGGTIYGGTQWRLSTTSVVVGTTNVSIVQFGAASSYSAGNGLSLAGSTFSANAASALSSGGPGGGLVVSSGGIALDTNVITRKYLATIGDAINTVYTVTHGFGTQDVTMSVRMNTTPYSEVECDMAATNTTQCTFTFAAIAASGAYRVMILG